jgi:arabinofuranosyltransferase
MGGLLFVSLCLTYRNFWLDDAFITFRYAQNLALGHGAVFNPGEAVEGYTNFLWMLATTVAFVLLEEARALLTIKAAGVAIGLVVLWRCYTFPPPLPATTGGASRPRILVVLLAANPVFVANCTDGLETALFMWLLVECARAFVAPATTRSAVCLGFLTAAAAWTRPEALPLLLVWPALWALAGRATARGILTFGATALPLVLAHVVWRITTYGVPLPNTFYAKATGALAPRLAAGGADLAAFATSGVGVPPLDVWLAVVLAAVGSRYLLRTSTPAARAWLLALWALVAFRAAFDVWSGSQFMGTFRFLAPALPALFVLADEGFQQLRRDTGSTRVVHYWVTACAIALAVTLFGNLKLAQTRARYQLGLEQAHRPLGEWLRATYPPETWVAIGDAGAIPFYSRLPVLDLWGLSDATIARLPGEYGDRPGTADYVLARKPGVIVLWNLEPISGHTGTLRLQPAKPFGRAIAGHDDFRRSYRFVREFTFREKREGNDGYYLDVFEHRPDARPRPQS